jgi:EmrB/QacA subfamily drug resistance transporter
LSEPEPLRRLSAMRSYPWLVVATVCIGAFIGQLDASVITLILPTLEETFHSSLGHVQWVAISYLLILTGLLTPLGHLADRLGRKALYTIGFLVFIAGSAFCGLAPDIVFLIGARCLQGVGAAMLQANSVAIITAAVSRGQLGRAIGIQGTAQAVGLAVGPAVGGFLISWLGWRWVFLINVPIGLMGALAARLVLPRTTTTAPAGHLNLLSALVLPLIVAALLLAFTFVGQAKVFLALTFLLLAIFVHAERRAAEPLLSREVLRAPGLAAGIVAALLSYTVLFGGLLAVPLLLERVFLQSPDRAGLTLTIVPVAVAIIAQLGGFLEDRFGPRPPTAGGMSVTVLGLGAIWWGAGYQLRWLLPGLVLFGTGMGLFIPANNASVMAAAPGRRLGVAGGLINMMRGLGASFGVALVSVILVSRLAAPTHTVHPGRVVEGIRIALTVLIVVSVLAGLLSLGRHKPPGTS